MSEDATEETEWDDSKLAKFGTAFANFEIFYKPGLNASQSDRIKAYRLLASKVGEPDNGSDEEVERLMRERIKEFWIQYRDKLLRVTYAARFRDSLSPGHDALGRVRVRARLLRRAHGLLPRRLRAPERALRLLPHVVQFQMNVAGENNTPGVALLVLDALRRAHAHAARRGRRGAVWPLAAQLCGVTDKQIVACWERISRLAVNKLRGFCAGGDAGVRLLPHDWRAADLLVLYHGCTLCEQESFRAARGPLWDLAQLALAGGLAAGPWASRDAWTRAHRAYLAKKSAVSLVVLQRRWFELCAAARRPAQRNSALLRAVAKWFPEEMARPQQDWADLVKRGLIYDTPLDEMDFAFDDVYLNHGQRHAPALMDGWDALAADLDDDDLVLVEQDIETIDLMEEDTDESQLPSATQQPEDAGNVERGTLRDNLNSKREYLRIALQRKLQSIVNSRLKPTTNESPSIQKPVVFVNVEQEMLQNQEMFRRKRDEINNSLQFELQLQLQDIANSNQHKLASESQRHTDAVAFQSDAIGNTGVNIIGDETQSLEGPLKMKLKDHIDLVNDQVNTITSLLALLPGNEKKKKFEDLMRLHQYLKELEQKFQAFTEDIECVLSEDAGGNNSVDMTNDTARRSGNASDETDTVVTNDMQDDNDHFLETVKSRLAVLEHNTDNSIGNLQTQVLVEQLKIKLKNQVDFVDGQVNTIICLLALLPENEKKKKLNDLMRLYQYRKEFKKNLKDYSEVAGCISSSEVGPDAAENNNIDESLNVTIGNDKNRRSSNNFDEISSTVDINYIQDNNYKSLDTPQSSIAVLEHLDPKNLSATIIFDDDDDDDFFRDGPDDDIEMDVSANCSISTGITTSNIETNVNMNMDEQPADPVDDAGNTRDVEMVNLCTDYAEKDSTTIEIYNNSSKNDMNESNALGSISNELNNQGKCKLNEEVCMGHTGDQIIDENISEKMEDAHSKEVNSNEISNFNKEMDLNKESEQVIYQINNSQTSVNKLGMTDIETRQKDETQGNTEETEPENDILNKDKEIVGTNSETTVKYDINNKELNECDNTESDDLARESHESRDKQIEVCAETSKDIIKHTEVDKDAEIHDINVFSNEDLISDRNEEKIQAFRLDLEDTNKSESPSTIVLTPNTTDTNTTNTIEVIQNDVPDTDIEESVQVLDSIKSDNLKVDKNDTKINDSTSSEEANVVSTLRLSVTDENDTEMHENSASLQNTTGTTLSSIEFDKINTKTTDPITNEKSFAENNSNDETHLVSSSSNVFIGEHCPGENNDDTNDDADLISDRNEETIQAFHLSLENINKSESPNNLVLTPINTTEVIQNNVPDTNIEENVHVLDTKTSDNLKSPTVDKYDTKIDDSTASEEANVVSSLKLSDIDENDTEMHETVASEQNTTETTLTSVEFDKENAEIIDHVTNENTSIENNSNDDSNLVSSSSDNVTEDSCARASTAVVDSSSKEAIVVSNPNREVTDVLSSSINTYEVFRSNEDSADISEDIAVTREVTADIREDTAYMSEDAADISEDTAGISEDTAVTREDIADIREETAAIRDDTADIREDTAVTREDIAGIREQTADSREETADLREETADLREETADLREETADLREETADLREETADLKEETADLREETADLREETADLREVTADLKEGIADIKEDTADMSEDTANFSGLNKEAIEVSCSNTKSATIYKSSLPEADIEDYDSDDDLALRIVESDLTRDTESSDKITDTGKISSEIQSEFGTERTTDHNYSLIDQNILDESINEISKDPSSKAIENEPNSETQVKKLKISANNEPNTIDASKSTILNIDMSDQTDEQDNTVECNEQIDDSDDESDSGSGNEAIDCGNEERIDVDPRLLQNACVPLARCDYHPLWQSFAKHNSLRLHNSCNTDLDLSECSKTTTWIKVRLRYPSGRPYYVLKKYNKRDLKTNPEFKRKLLNIRKRFHLKNKNLMRRLWSTTVDLERLDLGELEKRARRRVAKKVSLPDIDEIRRINRGMLTAQVAPITVDQQPKTYITRAMRVEDESEQPLSRDGSEERATDEDVGEGEGGVSIDELRGQQRRLNLWLRSLAKKIAKERSDTKPKDPDNSQKQSHPTKKPTKKKEKQPSAPTETKLPTSYDEWNQIRKQCYKYFSLNSWNADEAATGAPSTPSPTKNKNTNKNDGVVSKHVNTVRTREPYIPTPKVDETMTGQRIATEVDIASGQKINIIRKIKPIDEALAKIAEKTPSSGLVSVVKKTSVTGRKIVTLCKNQPHHQIPLAPVPDIKTNKRQPNASHKNDQPQANIPTVNANKIPNVTEALEGKMNIVTILKNLDKETTITCGQIVVGKVNKPNQSSSEQVDQPNKLTNKLSLLKLQNQLKESVLKVTNQQSLTEKIAEPDGTTHLVKLMKVDQTRPLIRPRNINELKQQNKPFRASLVTSPQTSSRGEPPYYIPIKPRPIEEPNKPCSSDAESKAEQNLSSGQAGELKLPSGQAGQLKLPSGQAGELKLTSGQAGQLKLPSGQAGQLKLPSGQAGELKLTSGQAGQLKLHTGQAGELKLPSGQAGELKLPSGQAGHLKLPSGQAGELKLPSGQAGQLKLPSGQAGELKLPSGQAGQLKLPSGQAGQLKLPSGQAGQQKLPSGQAGELKLPSGQAGQQKLPRLVGKLKLTRQAGKLKLGRTIAKGSAGIDKLKTPSVPGKIKEPSLSDSQPPWLQQQQTINRQTINSNIKANQGINQPLAGGVNQMNASLPPWIKITMTPHGRQEIATDLNQPVNKVTQPSINQNSPTINSNNQTLNPGVPQSYYFPILNQPMNRVSQTLNQGANQQLINPALNVPWNQPVNQLDNQIQHLNQGLNQPIKQAFNQSNLKNIMPVTQLNQPMLVVGPHLTTPLLNKFHSIPGPPPNHSPNQSDPTIPNESKPEPSKRTKSMEETNGPAPKLKKLSNDDPMREPLSKIVARMNEAKTRNQPTQPKKRESNKEGNKTKIEVIDDNEGICFVRKKVNTNKAKATKTKEDKIKDPCMPIIENVTSLNESHNIKTLEDSRHSTVATNEIIHDPTMPVIQNVTSLRQPIATQAPAKTVQNKKVKENKNVVVINRHRQSFTLNPNTATPGSSQSDGQNKVFVKSVSNQGSTQVNVNRHGFLMISAAGGPRKIAPKTITVKDFFMEPSILVTHFIKGKDTTKLTILAIDASKPLFILEGPHFVVTDEELKLNEPTYYTIQPNRRCRRIVFDSEAAGQAAGARGARGGLKVRAFANSSAGNALDGVPDLVKLESKTYKKLSSKPMVYAQMLSVASDVETCQRLVAGTSPLYMYCVSSGRLLPVTREGQYGMRCDALAPVTDLVRRLNKEIVSTLNALPKPRKIAPRPAPPPRAPSEIVDLDSE